MNVDRSAELELITAIGLIVDGKMDNPEVVRTDPTRGVFVLDDAKLSRHSKHTHVEVTRYADGKLIRFAEHFQDVTPRHKPSILVYDYDIYPDSLVLATDPDDDISSLAKKRLTELLIDVTPLPPTEDELMRYSPSKPHLQRVLDALKGMRILID